MRTDKLSALMMGCFTAVSYALKGFDHYSEDGLTVGEWGGSILLALAFGVASTWTSFRIYRWLRKKGYALVEDDDD